MAAALPVAACGVTVTCSLALAEVLLGLGKFCSGGLLFCLKLYCAAVTGDICWVDAVTPAA